ncbi:MAG TPA: hypothetical protein VF517_11180 [Thermoleophilaceae bacterium]|jgi:hypothetical protein
MAQEIEGLFEPSRYELQAKDLEITYTQLVGGVPDVTIKEGGVEKRYHGTQVRVDRETGLGRIVTVMTDFMFDGNQTTLSLLLPSVNFGDKAEVPVRTVAIQTVHKGSIGGPQLIDGQLSTYKSISLRGKARRIRG